MRGVRNLAGDQGQATKNVERRGQGGHCAGGARRRVDTPTLESDGILASTCTAPDSEVLHALHKRLPSPYALRRRVQKMHSLVFAVQVETWLSSPLVAAPSRTEFYAQDDSPVQPVELRLSRYAGLSSYTQYSTFAARLSRLSARSFHQWFGHFLLKGVRGNGN